MPGIKVAHANRTRGGAERQMMQQEPSSGTGAAEVDGGGAEGRGGAEEAEAVQRRQMHRRGQWRGRAWPSHGQRQTSRGGREGQR